MTKVHIVKVMAFPVVMLGQGSLGSPWGHKESDTAEQLTHIRTHTSGCESWTIKKAELLKN